MGVMEAQGEEGSCLLVALQVQGLECEGHWFCSHTGLNELALVLSSTLVLEVLPNALVQS